MSLIMYLSPGRHNFKPIPPESKLPVDTLEALARRWHKAGHIHGWFVKNVQNGQDDYKNYHVSVDKLSELLDAVNKILKTQDIKNDLLPFDAAPTLQDDIEWHIEWYFDTLEYTRDTLTKLLKPEYTNYWDFKYSSSRQ